MLWTKPATLKLLEGSLLNAHHKLTASTDTYRVI